MTNNKSIPSAESSLLPTVPGETSPVMDVHGYVHPVWDSDSLSHLETESADELSDDAERSGGFDDESSGTTRNPVVSYLRELKSIPLLSRDFAHGKRAPAKKRSGKDRCLIFYETSI